MSRHLRIKPDLLIWLLCLLCSSVKGQDLLFRPISVDFKDLTLPECFEAIEEKLNISIYYQPDKIPVYRITLSAEQEPLVSIFKKLLAGIKLDAIKYNQQTIVILDAQNTSRARADTLIQRWTRGEYRPPTLQSIAIREILIGDSLQQEASIQLLGQVVDQSSGDVIVGAVIKTLNQPGGITTDEDGKYELKLLPGHHQLEISYLGYQSSLIKLAIYASGRLDIPLYIQAFNLSEVVVESKNLQNKVQNSIIGVEQLSMRRIQQLSSFLGEADLIKNLENMAGISTTSEAMTGFNVRGGTADQNLILIDQAILYNTSHALGFFSVFNPDAVSNVQLYKGYIPPEFGNRLSSVLQVDLKEGPVSRWRGTAGIGLASARLGLNGPVFSKKTSILTSFRSSYTSWILKQIRAPEINESKVYFGDAVVKMDHELNANNKLLVDFFTSKDNFQFADEFGFGWMNMAGSLTWRHQLANLKFWHTHVAISNYESVQYDPQGVNAFDLKAGMTNYRFQTNYSAQSNRHLWRSGLELQYEIMAPEIITPRGEDSKISPSQITRENGLTLTAFIQDEYKWTEKLSLHGGVRVSRYAWLGPSQVYLYPENSPRHIDQVTGQIKYQQGKTIKEFIGIEPRLSVNWQIFENRSIKLAFNKLRQNIHQLSNTITPTPVDVWQLSTEYFPPMWSDNFFMGYFRQINTHSNWSLQLFYKKLSNILIAKDFAELIRNDHLETEFSVGKGKTYGLEIEYNKLSGPWQWNINYTWSRSFNRTTLTFTEFIVNDNQWFPTAFDQPHQLTIQFKKELNPVYSFNANFTLKSGRPITVPIGSYGVEEVVVQHFSTRNAYRLPPYHRLDFGLSINGDQTKSKGVRHNVVMSFYNLYGRKNPFNIFFRRNTFNSLDTYKLSVVGTVFPSLTWNILF